MGETFKLKAAEEGSEERGDWVPIPDNTFLTATVLSVKTVKKPFKDDNQNDVYKVEWNFEVTEDGEFKGRKIKGETSTNFVKHSGCKLFMWVQSVFGRELPEDFEVDTETLVGAEVRVHVDGSQGKEKNDKPGEFWLNQRVKDVLSAQKVTSGSAYAGVDDEEPF